MAGITVRTIRRIIVRWKKDGEPSTTRANCGRHNILDDRDRHSLKRLVKRNRRSSTQLLTSEFCEGQKRVYQKAGYRELKKIHLSKCKSTRKLQQIPDTIGIYNKSQEKFVVCPRIPKLDCSGLEACNVVG